MDEKRTDAERIARRHQADGAPIVSVYPGGVWGPCDPTLGEGIEIILMFVKRGIIPIAPGGIPIVDVRDLAALHLAAMQPGRGPRRYMAGGNFLGVAELTDTLSELTGRKLRKVPVSGALMRGIGRAGDAIRHGTGFNIGLTYEAAVTLTRGVPCDDSRVFDDFGIRFRPAAETFRDTFRWMHAEGILSRRQAGDLAG